ncbi:MAG: NUDIX domain-containing protein [Pseudomonadales bacterium]|nr:NUDIX domain-containing protein [Gammaproteobacteria bacterium]MBP6053029.1 NUDIX domain-containing protein [Pseudomonadales bacterium]MBK7521880.1 NUDIX domain-containing protein [Gammaproteobacteria bacterium]MBK8309411.1 NUDIX domain-containing protein [Gammaproteobacteria bacterium]MBK9665351.1 NUDIX domain-containing protein [Gammaproteobacteria bacterium]
MTEFDRADFEILEESVPWGGFWKLKVFRLRHRLFAGGWSPTLRRELHCRGEAVGVLLYDPLLDAIGVVEQFRVGAAFRPGSPWLLELVAGLMEEGETPQQVARREALEESGCEVQELLPVAEYFSSPGGTDEYFHLFCARTDLSDVGLLHGEPGEHEDIRLHVIAFDEALRMQQQGRFNNAHTLIALQWLASRRDEVRRAWS